MTEEQAFWQEQFEELKSSGGNQFLFPKADKTRMRLIGEGPLASYCQPVESNYNGKVSTKYLVMCFEITMTDDPPELRAAVLTKTAWQGICGLQAEGYDLFTADAVGTIIIRSNSGGRTSYQVMPAPKKVPVPADILQAYRDSDWAAYVKAFKEMQESRDKKGQGGSSVPAATTDDIADQIINAGPAPAAATDDAPW